jgi:hypothetical protein
MQYPAFFLTLLAATGAMASRNSRGGDKAVTVILRDSAEETVTFRREPLHNPVAARPNRQGPFQEVELSVGADVTNQALRCQILDENSDPIVVLRGQNTDITFSDADGGPWTLRKPSLVSKVVCDPDFEKIDPTDARLQVSVLLQSQATETGINFGLSGVVQNTVNVVDQTAFETVTLDVTGELVDPDLRCQLIDATGQNPIVVKRGENVDVTFGDGDKGEWTLQPAQPVKQIVCDPKFKKGSA